MGGNNAKAVPSGRRFKIQKKNIHEYVYKIGSLSNGYNKCVL